MTAVPVSESTDDEKLTVEAVLDYLSDHVVESLAAAVLMTDTFPEEALNELRASYTHLARANKHSDDQKLRAKELNSAHRHLRRVCLDALKICVMVTAQKAESAMAALTDDLKLPKNVHEDARSLRSRRIAISVHESKETTLGVIDTMRELFDDYDKFLRSLEDQFGGITAYEAMRLQKKRKWVSRIVSGFVGLTLGIIGSLIASYIYTNFIFVSETPIASTTGDQ